MGSGIDPPSRKAVPLDAALRAEPPRDAVVGAALDADEPREEALGLGDVAVGQAVAAVGWLLTQERAVVVVDEVLGRDGLAALGHLGKAGVGRAQAHGNAKQGVSQPAQSMGLVLRVVTDTLPQHPPHGQRQPKGLRGRGEVDAPVTKGGEKQQVQ